MVLKHGGQGPIVTVIILNWNGRELLPDCIDAILASHYRPLRILVADNGSTDGSEELVRKYGGLSLLPLGDNLGFSAGNNRAVEFTEGEYVAFLNNDVTVEPGWLEKVVSCLERDPTLAMASCRQMKGEQGGVVDGLYHWCTPWLTFEAFAHGALFDPAKSEHGCRRLVLSAQGASMVVRRSVFESLGGFDERFWAYHEDADFCLRALARGWRCLYVPQAVVHHKGSASFVHNSRNHVFLFERNRIWFIYKNFPASVITFHLPWILFMEARRLRGKIIENRFMPYLKARIEALRGLGSFRTDRTQTMAHLRKRMSYLRALLRNNSLPY